MIEASDLNRSPIRDYSGVLQTLLNARVDIRAPSCAVVDRCSHFEDDNVSVLRSTGAPMTIRNGPSRSGGLFLCNLREGSSTLRHELGSVSLRPGEFVLFRGGQSVEMVHEKRFEMLGVRLPEAVLTRVIPEWPLVEFMALGCGAAEGRLLFEIAGNLLESGATLQKSSAALLSDTMTKLLVLSTCSLTGRQERSEGQAEFHRRRVRQFCRMHLGRSDLSAQTIAQAVAISTSHLHRIFEGQPETLMAWIQSERLDACRAAIEDEGARARTLTDIAYSCGFKDFAHFSHAFKRRFGMSPRDFRSARSAACIE